MSYASAAALQTAIFELLSTDPELATVPVVDALPAGGGTGTFILIGPEEARDASDKSGAGADHRVLISVISDASGFLSAKTAAARVSEALVDAEPELSTGRVVSFRFLRGNARRLDEGGVRRIDLTFNVRIEI